MDQLKKFINFIVNLFTGLIVAAVHPMVKIARKHPIAFVFAVVIHITLVVGLLYAKVESWEMPEQKAGAQQSVPTKAVTIDVEVIKAERQRLVDLEQQKQDKLESEIKQSEAAKKAQKQAEERRDKAKEAALTAEEQKQLADKEREITEAEAAEAYRKKVQAEAEALTAEEKTQLADEERKKKEAEAAQAEAKAKEAEAKAKEAEAKAKEAEEAEELAKQLTEEERKKKEQLEKERAVEQDAFEKDQEVRSLTHEIQAEEDQERELVIEDQFSKLKSSYIGLIAARVKDQWRYMGAEDDWGCDVYIIQDEDGYVEAVNVQDCTIDESAQAASFRNSIERAVYKASPLPMAPDQSVFDTEIMFFFRVN